MPRQDPRLSVNKLGEYLTCSASRRRRILEDAKHPKNFIAPRYNDFYAVAPEYLASNPLDDGIITAAITEIQARQPGTEWDEQNKVLNVDLLGNLIDISDLLPIDGLTMTALPNSQNDLTIAGVTVSVRPGDAGTTTSHHAFRKRREIVSLFPDGYRAARERTGLAKIRS